MLINLVGLARFELTTFRPPDERATKLRHSPTCRIYNCVDPKCKDVFGKAAKQRAVDSGIIVADLAGHHPAAQILQPRIKIA